MLLPTNACLVKNMYSGLVRCIKLHPKRFSHIPQDFQGGNTVEEHIKLAEELASRNKGILQSSSWLSKNKYSGLAKHINMYPDRFRHIKQKYEGGKTIEECIKIAEDLAKNNNGILPNQKWLAKNGYNGLQQRIKNNRKAFSHIKQEHRGGKKVEEWVKIAEDLVKKHQGTLPTSAWLRKNGYCGLSNFIYKYPKKFSHMTQEHRKCKTPNEWIREAEKLAKKNNGILPNVGWLQKNGYDGVSRILYKFPEKFKHLKRDKKSKIGIDGWVEKAKELAKNHNGILPKQSWLSENGYSSISYSIRKHPEKFKGIKQERKKGMKTKVIGEN